MALSGERGVELIYELITAADNLERMTPEDIAGLLCEAAMALADLLKPEGAPTHRSQCTAKPAKD
ncbi:hypothetical protein [Mesorhizobium sp. INR15]|uniref:hypothetical protein n=1 Tax=Mesorhizobium sp. INR15 TaxID=2654248 RepID=UPI0018968BE1|nr:hypothetical protein [Mesorhizobium sp. INR15]QPC90018.1 hypothetical protein GA829_05110 [Mesorhizobium sp. INR15]